MDIKKYRALLNKIDPERVVMEVLSRAHVDAGHNLSHKLRTLSFAISNPEHFCDATQVFKIYNELIAILFRRYAGYRGADISNFLGKMRNVEIRIEELVRQKKRSTTPKKKRKRLKRRK